MSNTLTVKKVSCRSEELALRKIWRDIFGDTYEYIEDFYKTFDIKESAYVALLENEVVGIVNSLKCRALCKTEKNGEAEEKMFSGRYIYALAVKKEHRGRGFAKELLKAAEGDDFTVLIPENEGLFAMYRHLGYTVDVRIPYLFVEPHKKSETNKMMPALVKSVCIKDKNTAFFI